MATAEETLRSQSQSADSYVGSFISLISKSEIRYEGVLFHINPLESSIALENVRTFGTEGRKKDGPQVLPSDKVYDYIRFRGSDIKSHYHHPAASSSMPHSNNTSSMTSFSSNSHLALPSSTFQGSMPQYQPVASPTPTTVNSNEHMMSMYWQGLNGPSGGYSYSQPQSLLRPPPDLLASPGLRHMQHYTLDASIPSAVPNFPEIPHSLFPSSSASSLNSTPLPSSSTSSLNSTVLPSSSASPQNCTTLPPSSSSSPSSTSLPPSSASSQNSTTLPPSSSISPSSTILPSSSTSSLNSTTLPHSNYSFLSSTVLPPSSASSLNSSLISISSSVVPSNLPVGLAASSVSSELSSYSANYEPNAPGLTWSSSLPLETSLTSGVDAHNIALQFGEKSKSTLGFTSPYPNMSTPTRPIVGTSGSSHPEIPTPSLVTPGQLLESAPTSPATILTSCLPLQTTQKDIEVVQTSKLESLSVDANKAQAPSVKPYGTALHTPGSSRGYVEEEENKFNGVTLQPHHNNKVHVRGRRNGFYGTARRPYYGSWGRAQGRTNRISHSVTKFTEDFDFEAMNEKFNKDEVWGQLGKSIKGISEDNGDADDSEGDDRQHEDGDGLQKVGIKPVYVKDEFFDSLSCNTFDREPKKGRSKFSEQKKLDAETFGSFQINRGGRGVGRGGWSRGSRYGRGYGHAGRGQGRAVWSRVT
ncbi:hypothetical protein PTKIN_Ptkin04bG0003200 [Pterospermum kingtungense]